MIDSYPVDWFAQKIVSHSHVDDAAVIDEREVALVRKRLSPITVVPVRSDYVLRADVEEVLADRRPTLVVLINRDGHYAWTARDFGRCSVGLGDITPGCRTLWCGAGRGRGDLWAGPRRCCRGAACTVGAER
ncbi:MAG TPA: hypothetical protein VK501_09370, partial [Baekduia sp.]|nr:hypothetical protein [Baekduia sp.]